MEINHDIYDQETIGRVVANLRAENHSMICDMLIQTWDRAATAEAKLREWETAVANNDPYITNGGYVEVEVLEAVKRRNAELLQRAEAAEADAETANHYAKRALEAEAKLAANTDELRRLMIDTDVILAELDPKNIKGAINWGDLGARETQEVIDESRRWYRVIIEEADPANPALHAAVLAGLAALGWKADDVEIETEW